MTHIAPIGARQTATIIMAPIVFSVRLPSQPGCTLGLLSVNRAASAGRTLHRCFIGREASLLFVCFACLLQHIPHGKLDVNRLAVMPQEPNIIATCSDEAEVRYQGSWV